MFRVCKLVTPKPNEDSVDFYLTRLGFWSSNQSEAKHYASEKEVDRIVEQLNNKADRHYCSSMNSTYRITTYIKEEV